MSEKKLDLRKTDPCVGFYADDESEYDIRHFTEKFNAKPVIDGALAELRAFGWKQLWSNRTKSGTFVVLHRPRGKR